LRRWMIAKTPLSGGDPNAEAPPPPGIEDDAEATLVIDMKVINQLRALDRKGRPSRLDRAVSRFMEIAPPLVAGMRENFESGDADLLWRAAHSLKSSAGALGATRLSRRCAEIEAFARQADIARTQPLVEALGDDLSAAISGLRALIGELHVSA
jgi:HPt (histidine-containing phosphotransfer) domain-containing protein